MDRKKIKPQYITKVFSTKGTAYTKRYKGHTLTSSFIYVATDNPESEANQNLTKAKHRLLRLSIDYRADVVFEMLGKSFDRCKSGHPSVRFMTPAQRTKLITLVCVTFANVASRVLAYQLNIGLSPRQIGQIRRWHNELWRTATPKI